MNTREVEDTEKTKGSGWRRLLLLLGAIIAAALLIRFTSIASHLTLENLHRFREAAGVFAPLIFIAAYAVGTIFAFPGSLLTLSGGLLFGTVIGTVLVVIGATTGATLAFLLARYAGRRTVERFLSGTQLEKFDRMVTGSGLSAVLFTRFVPLLPFNLLNFAWGLTGVKLRDYVIGTALGILPGSFVYANLAGAVARSLQNSDSALSSVNLSRLLNRDVLIAFAILGLLALVPVLIRVMKGRGGRNAEA